jgi:HK97 family phage major capsid protein
VAVSCEEANVTYAELMRKIATKNARVGEIFSEQDKTAKNGGEPEALSDDLKKEVKQLNHEIEELEEKAAELKPEHDARLQQKQRAERLATVVPTVVHGGGSDPYDVSEDSANRGRLIDASLKRFGSQLVDDEAVSGYIKSIAPNGEIPRTTRVQTPSVGLKGWTLDRVKQRYRHAQMLSAEEKALVVAGGPAVTTGGGTGAGAFIVPQQYGEMIDLPYRPLVMRDVVTVGNTGSEVIEYVRMTDVGTSNAAGVAEATNISTGTKPESVAPGLLRISTTVKTVAHWIPITKKAIADAPQMRTLVDGFLMNGLDQTLEDQMVQGDNTGENFQGILNTPGLSIQAYTAGTYPTLTTLRKGRTKSILIGRVTPNAILLNPNDWETIDLITDGEDRYLYGGPSALGTPRIWGLPVIEAEAIPAGVGLVGDFRNCILWDREQAAVQMSDSHSDFFIKNLVALLAELRAAFGILRPAGIVNCDLTP